MATTEAGAGEVALSKGQLTHAAAFGTQVVAAANNTDTLIKTLEVECGFFLDTNLLAVGTGFAQNVQANQTAYVEVLANNAGAANRTECRVGFIDQD